MLGIMNEAQMKGDIIYYNTIFKMICQTIRQMPLHSSLAVIQLVYGFTT